MDGFITQIAQTLYAKHGDEISSLAILFPGRRARLFFGSALADIAERPLWQPSFPTIDEMMSGISGLRRADGIRLITELYKIYSRFHEENFDEFYPWGEMLLADFDAVDKYLVDARVLFSNIADLHELEGDLSYLTSEQRAIIGRFWGSLGPEDGFSGEKRAFTKLWRSLGPIYEEFRARLAAEGLGYPGMIYRDAAEKIGSAGSAAETGIDVSRRYVVAGFNAITPCERKLFDLLGAMGAEFFWDRDKYYMDDLHQEAGDFMRVNMERYPQTTALPGGTDNFSRKKDISVINSPSDTMQCRYAGEFVRSVTEAGHVPDKRTAIVLADEEFLVPVLHSVPDSVADINVTMGYPFRLTTSYSFLERLTGLQARRRSRPAGVSYYHADVTGLLGHPFVQHDGRAAALAGEIAGSSEVYITGAGLAEGGGVLGAVFTPATGEWRGLSEYLLRVADAVIRALYASRKEEDEDAAPALAMEIEYLSILADTVRKLSNSIETCGVEISERSFSALLRKALRGVKIPYEGEPLKGLQVMGLLETRNLDFENVAIISLNDDTFPGNRIPSSFIPHNLRLAYGLPTQQYHESVYAYDFYRLLQRARRIDLVYSSRSDDRKSGEPSRYIYQLEYESPHEICRRAISLDVNASQAQPITVAKDAGVMEALGAFTRTDGTAVKLSPTALSNYIACPLRFYFYSVARLKTEQQPAEEVDDMMFGTLLHGAAERLYGPIVGNPSPQEYLRSLVGSPEVDKAATEAVWEEFPSLAGSPEKEWGGNVLMVRDIIVKYLNSCLLPYDAVRAGYRVEMLEEPVSCPVRFGAAGADMQVTVGGLADRIDRLDDGRLMVIDYKTGAEKIVFRGVDALFSPEAKDRNPAVFQTLVYSMALNDKYATDVVPALYFLRGLNSPGYSPLPEDKERGVRAGSYLAYSDTFPQRLAALLSEIFDPAVPFAQCEDDKPCQWCDFNSICRRVD